MTSVPVHHPVMVISHIPERLSTYSVASLRVQFIPLPERCRDQLGVHALTQPPRIEGVRVKHACGLGQFESLLAVILREKIMATLLQGPFEFT